MAQTQLLKLSEQKKLVCSELAGFCECYCHITIPCIASVVSSGPPRNVTAHPISSTELTITWRVPREYLQNGKIRHYNVSLYKPAKGEKSWHLTTDATAHWTVPNLHPYSIYHIRVAAITIGLGVFSPDVTVRMDEDGL